VTSADVLEGTKVRVRFDDGQERTVDLRLLMWGPAFSRHRSGPAYFRKFRVSRKYGTIVWPDGADLDPDLLHGESPARQEPSPSDLSA
jgi:Protein of unknown function (DUF2442)